MALVPTATYEAWFQRTSPVYKSFAYLWSNPLWQKRVPNGFSLCPFAWASLFSLLVFRPLVYLTLGLRWAATTLRLNAFVRWTDRQVLKVVNDEEDGPFMLPTALAALVVALIAVALSLWGSLAWEAYTGGILTLWLALWASLMTGFVCVIHWENTKGNRDRCRSEIYLRTVVGVSVLATALLHTRAFVDTFVGGPIWLVSTVVGSIWVGICWTASGLFTCIKWTLLGALSGLPYALITLIVMAVLGGIGYYLAGRVEPSEGAVPKVRLTKGEIDANVTLLLRAFWSRTDYSHWSGDSIRSLIRANPAAMELVLSRVLVDYLSEVPTELLHELVAQGRAVFDERDQRQAKRSELCKRFTAALARAWSPVAAIGRQCKVAASYAWALVKARKSQSCPYVVFKD